MDHRHDVCPVEGINAQLVLARMDVLMRMSQVSTWEGLTDSTSPWPKHAFELRAVRGPRRQAPPASPLPCLSRLLSERDGASECRHLAAAPVGAPVGGRKLRQHSVAITCCLHMRVVTQGQTIGFEPNCACTHAGSDLHPGGGRTARRP